MIFPSQVVLQYHIQCACEYTRTSSHWAGTRRVRSRDVFSGKLENVLHSAEQSPTRLRAPRRPFSFNFCTAEVRRVTKARGTTFLLIGGTSHICGKPDANDHRFHLTFKRKHGSTELETDVCDTLSDSPGKRENASHDSSVGIKTSVAKEHPDTKRTERFELEQWPQASKVVSGLCSAIRPDIPTFAQCTGVECTRGK